MTVLVKICGLTTPEAVDAAAEADFLGFVFYDASPRHVRPLAARALASRSSLPAVAVVVDATDTALDEVMQVFRPTLLQLHGAETPERVAALKARYGVKVIKAICVADERDVAAAAAYEEAADYLLFDAKIPHALPGGTGQRFDWRVLRGRGFALPWFLSGGIAADNVDEALQQSGARGLDVSSRLERAPGVKDPAKIKAFLETVKHYAERIPEK